MVIASSSASTSAAGHTASLPTGHVGLVELPGTNRRVWWTGRVAIGLRYERPSYEGLMSSAATWVQELLVAPRHTR